MRGLSHGLQNMLVQDYRAGGRGMKIDVSKENMTIYGRDPNKNYAFVKIGEIGSWIRQLKTIRINGVLYTLSPVKKDE